MRINVGRSEWKFPIEAVRVREPEAVYVADLAIKYRNGNWGGNPVSVYYVAKPRGDYTNQYFGLSWKRLRPWNVKLARELRAKQQMTI